MEKTVKEVPEIHVISRSSREIRKTEEWLRQQIAPDTPERLAEDRKRYEEGVEKCVIQNTWMDADEIRKRLWASFERDALREVNSETQ